MFHAPNLFCFLPWSLTSSIAVFQFEQSHSANSSSTRELVVCFQFALWLGVCRWLRRQSVLHQVSFTRAISARTYRIASRVCFCAADVSAYGAFSKYYFCAATFAIRRWPWAKSADPQPRGVITTCAVWAGRYRKGNTPRCNNKLETKTLHVKRLYIQCQHKIFARCASYSWLWNGRPWKSWEAIRYILVPAGCIPSCFRFSRELFQPKHSNSGMVTSRQL